MFICDHTKLCLSFNEFHDLKADDLPEYGEFCLLELKDGSYTGGEWDPKEYRKASTEGKFIRGTADSIPGEDVIKWHKLHCYDLSALLEEDDTARINMGHKKEDGYSVSFSDFKLIKDRDFPKSEQYCLLILMDGTLAAGRWDKWSGEKGGCFIYAPALASYSMNKVWAWTPLSSDEIFAAEEERENERLREEELNKNPSTDPDKFKYGIDINVYYEKALEKLRSEYPWASMTQMKKQKPWEIVPLHGQYVFGQVNTSYDGYNYVKEWTDGSTAEEFIDFLCEYTRKAVEDSDPDAKFRYGKEIEIYLEKAYTNIKKDYHWADKKALKKACPFAIKQINGEWEFIRFYPGSGDSICDVATAEEFIESVERDYREAALEANPVVAEHEMKFGHIEIHGWNLERYIFYKLKSGDYKVSVTAGDRVTGGSRTFFITPDCFEAKTYDEFLDRYLKIVPGESFGLLKKDLQKDQKLKNFLGY